MRGSVPGQQAADVGVVADEHQHGNGQRQLNEPRIGQSAQARNGAAAKDDQRGQRGDPARRGNQQPDRAGGQPDRPGGGEQHAEAGRDPLAALEAAARPGRGGRAPPEARPAARPPARPATAAISTAAAPFRPSSSNGRRRQPLAAGAQHVGRADIARADLRGCRPARRRGSAAGRTGSSPADSRTGQRPGMAWRTGAKARRILRRVPRAGKGGRGCPSAVCVTLCGLAFSVRSLHA